jgi:hypothetical protein
MGPEGEPDTKMNWATDRRPQDKRKSTQLTLLIQYCSIKRGMIEIWWVCLFAVSWSGNPSYSFRRISSLPRLHEYSCLNVSAPNISLLLIFITFSLLFWNWLHNSAATLTKTITQRTTYGPRVQYSYNFLQDTCTVSWRLYSEITKCVSLQN